MSLGTDCNTEIDIDKQVRYIEIEIHFYFLSKQG